MFPDHQVLRNEESTILKEITKTYGIALKQWQNSMVLSWKHVLVGYNLMYGQFFSFWSFRSKEKLCHLEQILHYHNLFVFGILLINN